MANPTKNLADAWQQGDQAMNAATRQRSRQGRTGTLGEVLQKGMRDPVTKLGDREYSSQAQVIRGLILSGDVGKIDQARKMFAALSPAEREVIEVLLVQAMPNPRGGEGLSEGAREILGSLSGRPLSPERELALSEAAAFEGFSWDRARPDAPMAREAPEDRLPPAREDGIVPRPEGLAEQVVDAKEVRPDFRGPQEEIDVPAGGFVAPPLDTATRLRAGKKFDATRETQKVELRRMLEQQVAGKGKRDVQGRRFLDNSYIRRTINKIFPGMGKDWSQEFADEVTAVINSNDIAAVNRYIEEKFPPLTPEQRDAEIDRIWQERHEKQYRSQSSTQGSRWTIPYDDKRRIEIARKAERGERLTKEERKLLSESVGSAKANRSRMDVGEESDHQQFVRNLTEVLGYRPGFDPAEYQAGRSYGRPRLRPSRDPFFEGTDSAVPQNIPTGVGRADPAENYTDEFDPSVVAEGDAPGFAPRQETRRLKPPRKVGKGPRSDELSTDALDNLHKRLIVDVHGGQNVAVARPPAAYGFTSPEDYAQQIIRIANRGGEPVIPPTMIPQVAAELADKARKHWGEDLGAARLKATRPTADNAITETSSESRIDGLEAAKDRFRRLRAGEPVQMGPVAPAPQGRQPYTPPTREGTSRNPESIPREGVRDWRGLGRGVPNRAGEPSDAGMTMEEYLAAKEAADRAISSKNYLDPSTPLVTPPPPPRLRQELGPIGPDPREGLPPDEIADSLDDPFPGGEDADPVAVYDSSPYDGIFDEEPAPTPSTVRPVPTQIGQPDGDVVINAATPEDEARALTEAVEDDPSVYGLPEGLDPAPVDGPTKFVPASLSAEVSRQSAVIASLKSTPKQIDGAKYFYKTAQAKLDEMRQMEGLNPDAIAEYEAEVLKPLQDAIAARREARAAEAAATTLDGPDPATGAPGSEVGADEAVTIDPAPTPTPRARTEEEIAEAEATREEIARGRAAGMIEDNTSSSPLPLSPLEAEAARRANQRRTIANRQEALRAQGRAAGLPGAPPQSAKPVEAEAASEAAARKVDQAEAPRDKESDKAVAAAAVSKAETEEATTAAKPLSAPGTPTSAGRIRQLLSGVYGLGAGAFDAAVNPGRLVTQAVGTGLRYGVGKPISWASRNAPGLALATGGVVAANATKDKWMPMLAPYIPDEYEQPIADGLGAASDMVQAGARAVAGAVAPHLPRPGQAPQAEDAAGIGAQGVMPVVAGGVSRIDELPEPEPAGGLPVVPGMPGRPQMIEDESVRRIRRMLNQVRPDSPYAPQTPMRATTFYH